MHVGLDRVDGSFDDQLDADRRREVHDDIRSVHELGEHRFIGNAVDRVMELRMLFEMGDVVDRPRRQVVERIDLVAAREKGLGQVRTDKPGAAGYEDAHGKFDV